MVRIFLDLFYTLTGFGDFSQQSTKAIPLPVRHRDGQHVNRHLHPGSKSLMGTELGRREKTHHRER